MRRERSVLDIFVLDLSIYYFSHLILKIKWSNFASFDKSVIFIIQKQNTKESLKL